MRYLLTTSTLLVIVIGLLALKDFWHLDRQLPTFIWECLTVTSITGLTAAYLAQRLRPDDDFGAWSFALLVLLPITILTSVPLLFAGIIFGSGPLVWQKLLIFLPLLPLVVSLRCLVAFLRTRNGQVDGSRSVPSVALIPSPPPDEPDQAIPGS